MERIALHFLAEVHSELYEDPELLSRLTAAVRAWMRRWLDPSTRPRLAAIPLGRGLELVEDTRACAVERFVTLAPETADLLARLDRPVRPERVPEAEQESTALLVDRRLVIEHEGRLVSVVTRPALGHALRRQRRRLQDDAGSPMLESSA